MPNEETTLILDAIKTVKEDTKAALETTAFGIHKRIDRMDDSLSETRRWSEESVTESRVQIAALTATISGVPEEVDAQGKDLATMKGRANAGLAGGGVGAAGFIGWLVEKLAGSGGPTP